MTTLRAANEVREPEYDAKGKPPAQMVSLAKDIMRKLEGHWQPKTFHDEYQEALKALVKAKQKGKALELPELEAPKSNVVDLMSVLRRSLKERKAGSTKGMHGTAHRTSAKQKKRRAS